jgi:phosphatidylserine decarboxylase
LSNRIYPHPIIAREGWPILAGALIAVIVSWMLDLGIITFLFFVFLVFAFQFFRDPAREAPEVLWTDVSAKLKSARIRKRVKML